jgi:DNA invertase Pin-like site-specific DNA recombinase
MRIYPYLRASADDQDATRAKSALSDFAKLKGFKVSTWFIENVSGAQLEKPELMRLLDVAEQGDVLLVEQIDRLSRLNKDDWDKLKSIIIGKGIRVVALDLPTSHQLMQVKGDDFTDRMLEAINAMLMDMLAAMARKDYLDRRRRQKEGIKANKHKFKGRQTNKALHSSIKTLLENGLSYSQIQAQLSCSRPTIAKVKKAINS